MMRATTAPFLAVAMLAAVACADAPGDRRAGDSTATGGAGPLVVFNAGSLARPLRAALDSFAAANGVRIEQEHAGSLETARKLTELGRIPDVVALADQEVFPQVLMPEHATWYVRFARNRMVLAYGPDARHADELTADNWFDIVRRPGVEVGHSDPNLDPAGYRALLLFQLAERHYARPGLARELAASVPARNIRPKEVDLVALVQTGELDYIWQYESVARAAGLRFLELPPAIDLGDPTLDETYAGAAVRVAGRSPGDTITIAAQPIVYALSIPRGAPHPALAERFVAWLLGEDGRRILRTQFLDALPVPVIVGEGAPAALVR
jgi:molybdate/tungstate transport system substrate-binding protein